MTYKQTVDWMFQQLPMYQRIGKSAFKKDLSNTLTLAKHLGNPENNFKSIHVAGTNGKGSTCHMIAAILQQSGYKVGLYTSPHLKDFRERIRVNGEMISEAAVIRFIANNKEFIQQHKFSFFELTVGMAFQYFAEEQVDVAVIEVGMGGRLDSTNIITPQLSIITNIGLDHTAILGADLPTIAKEKAGIIKDAVPVVIGERAEETKYVFLEKAKSKNSPIYFAEDIESKDYDLDLKGSYQKKNLKTVLAAVKILRDKAWHIPESSLVRALKNVSAITGLRGRWEVLRQSEPKVICDTAHNVEGLKFAMTQLLQEHFDKLHIVLGTVSDKNLPQFLPMFPSNATYYFCKPDVVRGLDVKLLQEKAKSLGLLGDSYNSVAEAYKKALLTADKDDLIYVGGSTFTVAEVL